MKNHPDASSSVNQIRGRLIRILLRSFALVVILLVVSMIGVTTYSIFRTTGNNPFFRAPNASLLEAFYIGKGNWSGVNSLLSEAKNSSGPMQGLDWGRSVLLDPNGIVIVDHGELNSPLVGKVYQVRPDQNIVELIVKNNSVGYLVQDQRDPYHPIRFTFSVVNPILLVSLFLCVLTVVFGILLTSRVVDPLADVIAAAEKVASGDLSTRIKTGKRKDDLAALSEHFNHMTEELERNDRERREMMTDIAHELRTPITIMRGRLEGIVDGIYPANEASIAPALEETYLLERLVEDLRLLTLAESHQLHFELKPVNMGDLVKKVISVFQAQAEDQKVQLSAELDAQLPLVLVDPQRMEQVIGNLIGNSLRYIGEKGEIIVEVRSKPGGIEINVSDNGPGVPEDQLPYIFNRFWRSEKSRARSTGGAGLGLAIAKQLVESQGGTISAANRPEGGLKTTIFLPEAKPEE